MQTEEQIKEKKKKKLNLKKKNKKMKKLIILIELTQHYLLNRVGNIQDVFANCSGILLALIIVHIIKN